MFLSTLMRAITRLRRDTDAGAALIAVIGVMAVALILSTLVLSSIVNAVGYTGLNRADVQSQAAAEAGVAVAQSALLRSTCASESAGGLFTSAVGVQPAYSAQVQYKSGSVFVSGCPSNTLVDVRIVSAGTAASKGATFTGGNSTTVEASFSASVPPPISITATGPAVFSHSANGFTGAGRLVPVNGSTPSVIVKEGNTACSGGASGAGDWVIANGSLTIDGSCVIQGNVWASGTVSISGGARIEGNVVAPNVVVGGGTITSSVWATGTVNMSGGNGEIGGSVVAPTVSVTSGHIVGSVRATGALTVSGGGNYVGGAAEAASLSLSSSGKIVGNVKIYGTATLNAAEIVIEGTLTAKAATGANATTVRGKITVGATPAASAAPATAPARPAVPVWTDFDYDKADWVGFSEAKMSGACTYSYYPVSNPAQDAVDSFGTKPGIVDARGCTNGFILDGDTKVDLKGDVVIIANKFTLQGSAGFTAANGARLWLIMPDTTADKLPTCGGRTFLVTGGFSFSTPIATMLYTPCDAVISSSTTWRGQLYAGEASLDGGSTLGFIPIGLPGVNLGTGVPQGGPATAATMFDTPTSLRNVPAGG
jgi:cytoskeletal protein CcmA (bactofilin family)